MEGTIMNGKFMLCSDGTFIFNQNDFISEEEKGNSTTSLPFKLHIVPDPVNTEENYSSVIFSVRFTPSYPSNVPDWDLETVRNLSRKEETELRALIKSRFHEFRGRPMIFEVAREIEIFLIHHNEPPVSLRDKMILRKKKIQEQELERVDTPSRATPSFIPYHICRKYHFYPCFRQNFGIFLSKKKKKKKKKKSTLR
eukprot:TRINITY_DN7732_c0_g2_i1.p1 TRINITY_DN7732_c0_g2~~TRINITY_DN7732_c0_g2_i1.p1  ORF type:complete len:197 (+),score=35.91 TRINITY_DN7732_c0_g2_i1:167-757(+)